MVTVDKPRDASDDEDDLFFLPAKPIPDRELDGSNAAPAAPPVDDIGGVTIVEDPAEREQQQQT